MFAFLLAYPMSSVRSHSHHGLRTLTSRSGCPDASPSLLRPCSAAAAALPSPAQSRIEGCLAPLTPGGSSLTCNPPRRRPSAMDRDTHHQEKRGEEDEKNNVIAKLA